MKTKKLPDEVEDNLNSKMKMTK